MQYKIMCEDWNAPVVSYEVDEEEADLKDNVVISFTDKDGSAIIVPWSRVFRIIVLEKPANSKNL